MKSKLHIYLCLFVLGNAVAFAQTKSQNYIKTTEYKFPTSEQDLGDKHVKVIYFDGLGRPIQEVIGGSNYFQGDVVKHIPYELNVGQTKEYLPYSTELTLEIVSPLSNPIDWGGIGGVGTVPSNLDYQSNAEQKTLDFYNKKKYENTANPYSETVFEKSPLKRPIKQAAPGEDWKIATGSGAHNIDYIYELNREQQVKKYTAIATWNTTKGYYETSLTDSGYYPKFSLYWNRIKDENSKTTDEFKDQEGKVVMKRAAHYDRPNLAPHVPGGPVIPVQQNSVIFPILDREHIIIGTIHFKTHYVYDQFGNLSYVLPPLAEDRIDAITLDQLCYQYQYDHKNRLVSKKLPGKEWEYMVYDKGDRLVANGPVYSPFGDGSQGWLVNKYDVFGRMVYSGFYTGLPADESGRYSFADWVNNRPQQFENRATATTVDGVSLPYTQLTFPMSGLKILQVNFYDDYKFPNAPDILVAIGGQQPVRNAKGLQTGAWTRTITSVSESKGITSNTLYNYRKQVLRTSEANFLGGYTIVEYLLNFRGQPTKTITSHSRSGGLVDRVIEEEFTYNQAEQIVQHTHKVDAGDKVILTKNIYDNINTLVGKEVGALEGTSTFLQRVNFTYNIRGWLTQINDVDNSQLVNPNLFSLKLNYNKFGTANSVPGSNPITTGENKPLFNGNITQQIWRTAKSNIKSIYKYDYDDLNRLKNAAFQYPGMIMGMANAYNEKLTYDKNGNIVTLKRNGAPVLNNVIEIDDLQYSYQGNQLQTVTDATGNAAGFRKGSHTGVDYTYDGFGNMITDKNKGITDIKYNHLNLPTEITITGGKINYIYNAVGAKVQKIVTPTVGAVTTTDYLGGFQYENSQLQFFPTAEGYYNAQTNKYVYQYKDHLGNVRLSYSDTNGDGLVSQDEVLSESNYYPFGLQHQGDNAAVAQSANKAAEQYKYNGKELQDELGINLYDYGARNYDAALGRWMNVDPLAEDFPGWTPYHYVHNNPINLIDPTGMAAEHIDVTKNEDGTYKVAGGQANSDKNIYVVDGNGKRTGEVVGEMQTEYSFHHEDGSAVVGANIDLNDKSGQNFMDNEIKNIGLVDYISNAKGKEPLDFKHRGMPKGVSPEEQGQHHYRGMSFNGKVASARDIGNYAAGYVAGKHGFGWKSSRFAFDALQTKQEKGTWNTVLFYPLNRVREGQPTQQAERAGHNAGHSIFKQRQKTTTPLPIGPKW